MVRVPSTMVPLGSPLPGFTLPEPSTGRAVSLPDFAGGRPVLVMFLSNHCPFVKHLADELGRFAREYVPRGLPMVAINANDVASHPDDSPARMAEEVVQRGYPFPYLFDESQDVAKVFGAACTPDFFLYDAGGRLAYRGQFDSSRPSLQTPVTGADLRAACDAVLEGREPPERQLPSLGCNIKWKAGNAPPWFG